MLLSVKVNLLIHVFPCLRPDTYPVSMSGSCWLGQIEISLPWEILPAEAPEGDLPVSICQRSRVAAQLTPELVLHAADDPKEMTFHTWNGKLCCSSPLQCRLLPPDPRCILPNKCFSSLRSSDYTLHWIQIKRQNVSLISTVMWDR